MLRKAPKAFGLYDPDTERDACGIGAVVNISGDRDHAIIERGKQVLLNLHHRGAAGADETTGDGAGILLQIPDEFFHDEAERLGFPLPGRGLYGVAMVFTARGDSEVRQSEVRRLSAAALDEAIAHYGMKLLGRREVPGDNSSLGELAVAAEPIIEQVFIDGCGLEGEQFERRLFMARKRAERLVHTKLVDTKPGVGDEAFYVASMSGRTVTYKGMFFAHQLFAYYRDLADERMVTALALVHQRKRQSRPCWPPPRCITGCSRETCAERRASSSSPANPGRSCTSACCWDSGRTRSIRTSPCTPCPSCTATATSPPSWSPSASLTTTSPPSKKASSRPCPRWASPR